MSCPNSNSPIDINLQDVVGKCDLKCAYNFKYPNSSCVVTNRGDYVSISYDAMSVAPVTYNQVGYNVKEVRIYVPSLHSFDGNKVSGEIIIVHTSNKGTKPLLVCVPLLKNSSTSQASTILDNIVNAMGSSATSDGESTTVNIDDFTLDAFVPKVPFFSYTAIQPYQPCTGEVDLIVFSSKTNPCYISDASLTKLTSIIAANAYDIKSGPALFYNSKGPGLGGGIDEIYIDCKPVNQSSEMTTTTTGSTQSKPIDFNSIINSPLFQILIGSLLFIFIIFVFKGIVGALGGKSSKINLPNFFNKNSNPKV